MDFEDFWKAWHVKGRKGKTYAKKAFGKLSEEEKKRAIEQAKAHTDLFNGLSERYGAEILGSMKYPQGWLNAKRFDQPQCGIPEYVLAGAGLGTKEKEGSIYAADAYYRT